MVVCCTNQTKRFIPEKSTEAKPFNVYEDLFVQVVFIRYIFILLIVTALLECLLLLLHGCTIRILHR